MSAGFMDLHWPEVCIVEMKKPGTHLGKAREQVKRYWEESSDPDADVPAARYVVVCSFQEFEIWEPGRFPSRARAGVSLEDLVDRYEVLSFLAGRHRRRRSSGSGSPRRAVGCWPGARRSA